MNTKLDASVVLALALGCFASSANANMKYTPEYTNAWCSVESFSEIPKTTDTKVGGANGSWLAVPSGGVALESSAHSISIDTGVDDPLVYTNTAVGAGISRIVTKLTVTLSSELPAMNAKTAICVCTNATGTATWWAYINNSWTNLNVTAEIDTKYEIVLESDSSAGKIQYLVKKTSATEYTNLTGGWVDNSACSGAPITSISFAGSTTLAGFSGTSFAQGYAYNGTIYDTLDKAVTAATNTPNCYFTVPVSDGAVVLSATIPEPWISGNISGDTLNAKAAKLDDSGANGMKYWQSYVLALDPKAAASKPLVQPVQNTDAGTVAFTLGALPNSGVKVQYRVNAYDTPGSSTPSTEGSFVDANQSATNSLPVVSGVKYYKLEVKFGE